MKLITRKALRGHQASALQHVKCGVRILSKVAMDRDAIARNESSSNAEYSVVPIGRLAILFTRLDTQARQFQASSPWSFAMSQHWKSRSQCFCEHIPEVFSSIDEARNSMDFLWNDMSHILEETLSPGDSTIERSQDPRAYFERSRLIARCTQWSIALETYWVAAQARMSFDEIKAYKLMKMLALLGTVTLKTTGPHGEMVFDEFLSDYRKITELAEAVVDDKLVVTNSDLRNLRAKPAPRFRPDMGIIVALFEIVWKCRDPVVRRRIVTILEDNPMQDGLWDGILVAKIGRRIQALEEGLHCQNLVDGMVLKRSRISSVDLSFDVHERVAQVRFLQPYEGPSGTELSTSEAIEW